MKLVSYLKNQAEHLGLYIHDNIYPLHGIHSALPGTMLDLLNEWDTYYIQLKEWDLNLKSDHSLAKAENNKIIQILSPVPHPVSCRDGYAFRQHVASARKNRGVPMIPEFDQYPVFYFTNHLSIQGPGAVYCMPDHFEKLDFELEAAIVISKKGRNIKAEEADDYIGGMMIMNDLSARRLQMEEMLLNLGPAKGKDFCTTLGPYLVTMDELTSYEIKPPLGHTGKSWNLKMTCKVNDIQVSEGNLGDMHWTFAEIIERASYGVTLYPGDVIGSGTVGSGCFLELNGTGKLHDPHYKEQWLVPGDEVVLKIDQLGELSNQIFAEDTEYSILSKKKPLST